eukprot:m.44327 g.44327  ORF g.44327 m.44327 type:complete len:427 (+) comp10082_c0_seq4:40-1320(+)
MISTSIMLLSLPAELLHIILGFLRVRDLKAVCLVCRRLRHIPWPTIDLERQSTIRWGSHETPNPVILGIRKRKPVVLKVNVLVLRQSPPKDIDNLFGTNIRELTITIKTDSFLHNGASLLACIVQNNHSLRRLALKYDGLQIHITQKGPGSCINWILDAITTSSIQEIWLDWDLRNQNFVPALFNSRPRLQSLVLESRLDVEDMEVLASSLSSGLGLDLHTFAINSCLDVKGKQREVAIKNIVLSFDKHPQLRNLSLTSLCVGKEVLEAILQVLPQSKVTTLNLSSNRLGREASSSNLKVLCKAVHSSDIEQLNLSGNEILDRDVPLLLTLCSKLKNLNLSGNKMRNKGALEVARVLKSDTLTITSLDLHGNLFQKRGMQGILDALSSSSVKTINLLDIYQQGFMDVDCRFPREESVKYKIIGFPV